MVGIRYKGLTVKQFQNLQKVLPETTKLIVVKNTLLFVHSEEILSAIKPYRDFQKEKKLDSNDFTRAVFEGKFYDHGDFKRLETMPMRAKIYVKLLGMLNSPVSSLVGTIQAPANELIMLLKAYVRKLEEEGGSGGQ
ncbi:hypothetical protein TB1_023645 [Malus domestica]